MLFLGVCVLCVVRIYREGDCQVLWIVLRSGFCCCWYKNVEQAHRKREIQNILIHNIILRIILNTHINKDKSLTNFHLIREYGIYWME